MTRLWKALPEWVRNSIIRITPVGVGKLIYFIPLFILRRKIKNAAVTRAVEVWPRHSFVLGTFVPFVSDLDITAWIEGPANAEVNAKLKASVVSANGILPLIKEINVYGSDTKTFILSMNPFELDRDPQLRKKLEPHESQPKTKVLGAVFLFRMLRSDYKNIIAKPAFRKRKWHGHISAVNKGLSTDFLLAWDGSHGEANVHEILGVIAALCGFETASAQEFLQTMQTYMKMERRGESDARTLSSQIMWAFLPHEQVHNPHSPRREVLTGKFLEIFLAQYQWEIWGLGTQYFLLEDKRVFLNHIERIRQLFAEIVPQNESVFGADSLNHSIENLSFNIQAS